MGSCFRSKKKNSYTVTQIDEEYSAAGGKFQSKSDKHYTGPAAKGGQSRLNAAPQQQRVPTQHHAHAHKKEESPDRNGLQNGNDRVINVQANTKEDLPKPDLVHDHETKKGRNLSDTSTVSVKSDRAVVEVKDEEAVNFMASSTNAEIDLDHHRHSDDTSEKEQEIVKVEDVVAPVYEDPPHHVHEDVTYVQEEVSQHVHEEPSHYVPDEAPPAVHETTEGAGGHFEATCERRTPSPDITREVVETTETFVVETPVSEQEHQVTFKDTPETINYTPQVTIDEDEPVNYDSPEVLKHHSSDEDEVIDHRPADTETYHHHADDQFTTTTETTTTYEYDDAGIGGTSTFVSVTTTENPPEAEDYGFAKPYEYSDPDPEPQNRASEVAYDEVQITDSPAGTWDARLNSDVRAELDEVRRSLSSSRASSTNSLNATAEKSKTVQFDMTEQHEDTDHTVGYSVTTTTYTTETDTHYGHSEYDNDHNEQLAAVESQAVSEYESVGYDGNHEAEHGINYDTPSLTHQHHHENQDGDGF